MEDRRIGYPIRYGGIVRSQTMMNTKKTRKTEIVADLDDLEIAFEKNRQEMLRLSAENKRASDRYRELSDGNFRINARYRTLLEELWTFDEE